MSLLPPYLHQQERDKERLRKEQRIQFALRNEPNTSSRVAKDSVTYQKQHMKSMEDALKEVRKSKHTIPDGLHMRPENHKGFY